MSKKEKIEADEIMREALLNAKQDRELALKFIYQIDDHGEETAIYSKNIEKYLSNLLKANEQIIKIAEIIKKEETKIPEQESLSNFHDELYAKFDFKEEESKE